MEKGIDPSLGDIGMPPEILGRAKASTWISTLPPATVEKVNRRVDAGCSYVGIVREIPFVVEQMRLAYQLDLGPTPVAALSGATQQLDRTLYRRPKAGQEGATGLTSQ